jgi:hypothetical protein
MFAGNSTLQVLASQVEQGNDEAARQLRQELEPNVERMVRRAIRVGGASRSPVDRKIMSRVRALALDGDMSRCGQPDWIVFEVTRSLCDAVIGDLRRSPTQTFCLANTIHGL